MVKPVFPVDTMPGVVGVNVKTGWPFGQYTVIRRANQSDRQNLSLRVAARKMIKADPSLGYTSVAASLKPPPNQPTNLTLFRAASSERALTACTWQDVVRGW